jgi:hypothetical protein
LGSLLTAQGFQSFLFSVVLLHCVLKTLLRKIKTWKNVSARGSNAECENMMAEHEEVLATEFVVTTKRQDTTEWQCMRKYWQQNLNW